MKQKLYAAQIRDSLNRLETATASIADDLLSHENQRNTNAAISALDDFKVTAIAYLRLINDNDIESSKSDVSLLHSH